MNKTKIEWTEETWNPITGCTQHSDGCQNCYAKKMAYRLYCMKNPRYLNNFEVTIHEDLFDKPLKQKQPRVIFVCSMSDIFHDDVSFEIIDRLFEVMKNAHWHIFQVLTKRTERLYEYSKERKIPKNVWIGTTVESSKYNYRVELLKKIDAHIKFLSCEPLLGTLGDVNFDGIDWIVTGGESGANARAVDINWIREIRDQCLEKNIAFFFKQWGGWNKKKNGHVLDGKTYKELPDY